MRRTARSPTDGWSKLTGHDVVDLARKFEDYGVEAIIYTDIGRDGMLSGVNIEATVRLARAIKTPVIASGGLSSIEDIQALVPVRGRRHHRGDRRARASTKARWISRKRSRRRRAGNEHHAGRALAPAAADPDPFLSSAG